MKVGENYIFVRYVCYIHQDLIWSYFCCSLYHKTQSFHMHPSFPGVLIVQTYVTVLCGWTAHWNSHIFHVFRQCKCRLFFKILTDSCLASSAFSTGKDRIAFSIPVRMSSMGVDRGFTSKLRPFCNREDTASSSFLSLRLITVSFSFLVIGCCFLWSRVNFLICLALLSCPAHMALFNMSWSIWDQSITESWLAMRRCVLSSSQEVISSSHLCKRHFLKHKN